MTDPVVAARARVEDLLERLARVNLQVVVVAPPDAPRFAARERARVAAVAGGRGDLLGEAMAAARDATIRSFSRAGFSGTWAATDWSISVATASDRVAAAAAFEEAAMAEVVEDLIDDDTLDILRSSSSELDRSTGLPSPGSLSAFARSPAVAHEGFAQRAILGTFVTIGIGVSVFVGLGPGLLTVAVGAALAGLRGRNRRDS